MEEIFFNELKSFLAFIIPFMRFFLPYELKDGLTSGSEFGNESANVLQLAQKSPYLLLAFGWRHF